MDYRNIPILNALKTYSKEQLSYFHMPGHKGGNVYRKVGIDDFAIDLFSMDVTEVPGIDNLHCPEASIAEAQELAANAFGARSTFFLVNGTTSGIYAMILAATNPGDQIIIPRNCHKSVTGAVVLGRLNPVYISPELDGKLHVASGVTAAEVERAIRENPAAKAVVMTNPTFYGVCSDLETIAYIAHQHNMLLLVDEAHGSHFAFHKSLPQTSLKSGADMVAQSTHKTLASMTQSSMLHVGSNRVDIDKLRFFLQLTQSTSPSHVLLASLDAARYIMQEKGGELLDEVISACEHLRQELSHLEGLHCIGKSDIGRDGIFDADSTRVTVSFSGLDISGAEVDQMLRERFKLQVEMADLYNIVAICSIGDEERDIQKLTNAIKSIHREAKLRSSLHAGQAMSVPREIPTLSMLPWEAVYQPKEQLPIERSVGRVAAEMIVPFPPGIPIIMPGEILTKEILDYARQCRDLGIKINGVKDSTLEHFMVIK